MSGGRRRRELRKGRRTGGDLRPLVPICRGMGVLPLPLPIPLHAVTIPLLKITRFEKTHVLEFSLLPRMVCVPHSYAPSSTPHPRNINDDGRIT